MGILSETCAVGVGVGQLMQVSVGMMRTLVFTLNVMDPLWGLGLSRGELIWSPWAGMLNTGVRHWWKPGD